MTTVLVVDDEADVRMVARLILEGAGHDVREARSGEEALDMLETDGAPDAMLLDVRMSGMNGWDVLHRLRTTPGNHPDLPVVVFTADMSSVDDAPVDLRHRDHFLPKPFSSQQLLHAIDAVIS